MTTDKWTRALDALTQKFTSEFGRLSAAELNQKPNPQTWSIAQNLDHLRVINESYFPVLDALLANTYKPVFLARFGFLANWLGGFILKSVQPDRNRKMKTFPVWEPAQSALPADVVQQFARHQEQLKTRIQQSAQLLQKVISSPANKNIVYPLHTAFDILVAHEERHLAQAREAAAALPK